MATKLYYYHVNHYRKYENNSSRHFISYCVSLKIYIPIFDSRVLLLSTSIFKQAASTTDGKIATQKGVGTRFEMREVVFEKKS